jgi:hypothetical protein
MYMYLKCNFLNIIEVQMFKHGSMWNTFYVQYTDHKFYGFQDS